VHDHRRRSRHLHGRKIPQPLLDSCSGFDGSLWRVARCDFRAFSVRFPCVFRAFLFQGGFEYRHVSKS
jgi:hypothetical protein